MDEYFKLPTGYQCLDINSSDRVYAYTSNRRDTYILNGFKWEKVAETAYSSYSTCSFNYGGTHWVPHSVVENMILPAVLIVGALFSIILNWFKGIHNHV